MADEQINMMGKRDVPMIDGDEMDGLTRWKRNVHFKPGERKRLKRKFNKRVRYQAKLKLRKFTRTNFLMSVIK